VRSIERFIAASPVPRLLHRRHRTEISILAYHGVSDGRAFARQLEALSELVTFIGPDDLRAALGGAPLPDHPAMITFDDGERSVLDHGLEPIAAAGLQAMLFVCPGLLDTDAPFWWDEVAALAGPAAVIRLKTVPDHERRHAIESLRQGRVRVVGAQLTTAELHTLQAGGFEIGNHTWDHPCLDRCTSEAIERQIIEAHRSLADRGIDSRAFAYPNGNLDPRAEEIFEALGYDLGFVYDRRHAAPSQHHLRLSRLHLDASAPPERAQLVVTGTHGPVARALRR
jgi:peptidoglycan/xylan/chitin deacetylase (PgdA/CDA1 family)